ncbi:MAG: putative Ig domain-containing protein [Gammaproteobacteria bacterium]
MTYPLDISSYATGTNVSYSATGLPTGLSVDPLTGVVNGLTTAPGTYSPVITYTNDGGTVTQAFTWIVTAPGSAPASSIFHHAALSSGASTTVDGSNRVQTLVNLASGGSALPDLVGAGANGGPLLTGGQISTETGTGDTLDFTAPASGTYHFAFRMTVGTHTKTALLIKGDNGARIGWHSDGNALDILVQNLAGVQIFVDGSEITTTRGDLYDALVTGSPVTVRIMNVDMSDSDLASGTVRLIGFDSDSFAPPILLDALCIFTDANDGTVADTFVETF